MSTSFETPTLESEESSIADDLMRIKRICHRKNIDEEETYDTETLIKKAA